MHIRRPIPWLLMGLSKKIQTNAKNEKNIKKKEIQRTCCITLQRMKSRSSRMNNIEVQLLQRPLDDLEKVHAYLGKDLVSFTLNTY